MQRGGSIYIMTNRRGGVLYIGVTSDLVGRVTQHRLRESSGAFTARYRLGMLVYYEHFSPSRKPLPARSNSRPGSRNKKIALIAAMDPNRDDLYDALLEP